MEREWTAFLVTYAEGAVNDFSLPALRSLGAAVGLLHASADASHRQVELAPLARCRLDPDSITAEDLQRIEEHPVRSMAEFQNCFDVVLSTIERMKSCSLPATMLHGDCWPANAVVQPEGGTVLLDWEFAGTGPALADLGFLLMASHIDKPLLPELLPDPDRIAAVMSGYSQHYRLSRQEVSGLRDAVVFDPSRRLARLVLDGTGSPSEEAWEQNELLRTLVSRIAAAPQLADCAIAAVTRSA